MKKFYTISLMAFAAATVSAAPQVLEVTKSAEGLSIGTPGTEITASARRISLGEDLSSSSASTTGRHRLPSLGSPETATDWTSIGEGTYLEDLLTVYSDVPANQMWTVDVETSASNPGWYRFLPYASGPVAELLGRPDTQNYLYINASDPSKVYGLDFTAFNNFPFSNYVPESEWPISADEAGYGTLVDGCISFGTKTWLIATSQGYTWTTQNTGFKLFLPGAEVIDYSLSLVSDSWCGTDNEVEYTIKSGVSVAKVKAVLMPGEYPMNANNAAYVAQNGQELPTSGTITASAAKQGINSILFVALDANGNLQSQDVVYFFGEFENDADWKSIGTGKFTEGIYAANYGEIDNETMDVEIEESIITPGRYRIVNPYAGHSLLGKGNLADNAHGHRHYIYIDATEADRVFIEASPLGLIGPLGHGAINSSGAKYVGTEVEDQAKALGYFGTFNDETRTITYPDNKISLAEKDYENGAFLIGNSGTQIVLPDMAGVDGIAADDNAEAEYFNLQGVRISNPAAGQLVIKRQGSVVTKTIVR
ncbi:MAG: hypothetical protein K2J66_03970 [Muribaculaceae bacterium]|nr:hypothetical protein [Muribaculaceae bacterium]